MSMTITHTDGSITVLETDADIRLYMELTGQVAPPKVQTTAEKVAEALTAVRGVSYTPESSFSVILGGDNPVVDAAIMPESVEQTVERVGPNRLMPKRIELPPEAAVTQPQQMVLEVLRHHPEGMSTAEIAEKLRWDHSQATARISYLHLNRGLCPAPLVEKIYGHNRYRLSEFGKKARLVIKGQPSRHRQTV